MRRAAALVVVVLAASVAVGADPFPATPFTQDPMGPMTDVTASWQHYQPADAFCVKPDVYQVTDIGPTVNGADPACAFSGFAPTDRKLVKIEVRTPALCGGCRRLFIDYSKIPALNSPPRWYAHGHAYLHLASLNPSFTVEPVAHSPNIKNFTNDKLFVPDGSFQENFVWAFDARAIAYTGNTSHVVHSEIQGPYYTGPWYVSRDGVRIAGAYLDVDVQSGLGELPLDHRLNEIAYMAGFHSGDPTCPDEALGGGTYADGDFFYGGCIDHFGGGRTPIDPFS
jgi:hypothetical protein